MAAVFKAKLHRGYRIERKNSGLVSPFSDQIINSSYSHITYYLGLMVIREESVGFSYSLKGVTKKRLGLHRSDYLGGKKKIVLFTTEGVSQRQG